MHNLALALHSKGFIVSGSDDEINEPSLSRLRSRGLLPEKEGWDPENITPDLDAVILGMHARKDNPELLKAQEIGIPVYSFPEYLYEETRNKTRVVIGGSHGKTTITSMIMHVMKSLEKDFDYMVGASIEGFDTMVRLNDSSRIAVLEGDEYLSSPIDPRPKFHLYHPQVALLSGIAWDHINVFPTKEIYERQFVEFIKMMEPNSVLVYSRDDETLERIVKENGSHLNLKPYTTPDFSTMEGKTTLKTPKGDFPIQVFGTHNLRNIEGARLVCETLDISPEEFYRSISTFKGAARRLEKLGEKKDVVIFRDFAHSPSKLKATTNAVKDQYPDYKLIACMELHTFSSLNADFLEEYRGSMDSADEAIVYFNPATIAHKKLDEITPEQVEAAFGRELKIFTKNNELEEYIRSLDLSEISLLLMSSGTFGGINLQRMADELLN